MNAKTPARPYKIFTLPQNDFAVQRFIDGRIQRWNVYPTRGEAELALPVANAAARREETHSAGSGLAGRAS